MTQEGYDEHETGTCHCNLASENGKYCRQWQCFQVETDNEVTCECTRRRLYEDYNDCTRRCYREQEAERTDCACDEADHHMESNLNSSNFCSSWSCVEVDTKKWKKRDKSEENWFGSRMVRRIS